jgi:hypothetical protein
LFGANAIQWQRRDFVFYDSNPDFILSACRPEKELCLNVTNYPPPRQNHIAILFTSYDYDLCAKYVYEAECSDAVRKNLTCTRCD